MGFFDKLKSAAGALTGGGAKVTLEVGPATIGEPITVSVSAVAKNKLKVDAVYLLVHSTEKAEFVETEFEDGEWEKEVERGSKQVFNQRFNIAGAAQLEAGQSYNWEGSFVLPESANPSFYGQIIRHVWQIQAGLDAFGNDPDSGWQELRVE